MENWSTFIHHLQPQLVSVNFASSLSDSRGYMFLIYTHRFKVQYKYTILMTETDMKDYCPTVQSFGDEIRIYLNKIYSSPVLSVLGLLVPFGQINLERRVKLVAGKSE